MNGDVESEGVFLCLDLEPSHWRGLTGPDHAWKDVNQRDAVCKEEEEQEEGDNAHWG